MALRPVTFPALAALLVVLAGCGSVSPGGSTSPDGTVTAAPVPTDSPTPPPERATVPAPLVGATPNETTLALLHAESLARRSYRLTAYDSRSRGEGFARSVQNRLDRRSYRVQSGGTYRAARVVLVVGSGPAAQLPSWEAYADGEAEYRRVVGTNGTSYERRSLAPAALPPHQGETVAMIVRYLDVAEATVEHVSTERGPRLRVVGREPRSPELANASNYRVEAIVTGSGRVEMLEARYALRHGISVRTGFRVRDVGSVGVGPPDWYGEARAETLDGERAGTTTDASDGTRTPGTREPTNSTSGEVTTSTRTASPTRT